MRIAKVFFQNADREMYLGLLGRNLHGARVRVLAYTLMTNHIHAVVVPERNREAAALHLRRTRVRQRRVCQEHGGEIRATVEARSEEKNLAKSA